MSKVIYFDEAGEPQGVANFVYDGDAQASGGVLIPEGSDDQAVLDTWYFKAGEIKVRSRRPSQYHFWDNGLEQWVEDLARLREDSLQEVDSSAEAARSEHVTPGSGQAMTYEQKHREALAGGGPLLEAEAESLDMTVEEVATAVLEAHQAWLVVGARIEAVRLRAKRDIRAAETAAEMHAIVKALEF